MVSDLPYLRLRGLGITVQVLIAASLFLQLVAFTLGRLANELGSSGLANITALVSILGNISSIVHLGVSLFVPIFFIIWMRRLLRNLPALNVEGIKSRSWQCIWGFFIPVMNLYKPMTILQEIWKASDSAKLDTLSWQDGSSSKLIFTWWAFFLISNLSLRVFQVLEITGNIQAGLAFNTPVILLFLGALHVVSDLLAIIVVGKLSLRQDNKRSLLMGAPNLQA